jgi:hypothetical protein
VKVGDLVRFKEKGDDTEYRRRHLSYFFEVGLVLGPYLNGETRVMFPSDTDFFITDMLEVLSEST